MATDKPIFLDVTKMRFPITAMVSIAHRISGVLLFLLLPFCLYLLDRSLASAPAFAALKQALLRPGMAFLLWVLLSSVTFHLFAGLRHLLMDCGIGEHLKTAKLTAWTVILVSLLCMILLGVWVW